MKWRVASVIALLACEPDDSTIRRDVGDVTGGWDVAVADAFADATLSGLSDGERDSGASPPGDALVQRPDVETDAADPFDFSTCRVAITDVDVREIDPLRDGTINQVDSPALYGRCMTFSWNIAFSDPRCRLYGSVASEFSASVDALGDHASLMVVEIESGSFCEDGGEFLSVPDSRETPSILLAILYGTALDVQVSIDLSYIRYDEERGEIVELPAIDWDRSYRLLR